MKLLIYSICIPVFFFILFCTSCNRTKSKNGRKTAGTKQQKLVEKEINIPDTILLVSMAFSETYLIDPIETRITSFYHIPVKHIIATLPAFAFFKQRNRYRADSLLNYLADINKGRYRFVAGLTSKDISCTNGKVADWGVFGLGSLSGKGCITSSFRLKKNASLSLLTERIQKVILHEIGHNHGLVHCLSPYPCFMKAANGKISEVDSEPMDMCKLCRQKANL
jgi:archaemetzincin